MLSHPPPPPPLTFSRHTHTSPCRTLILWDTSHIFRRSPPCGSRTVNQLSLCEYLISTGSKPTHPPDYPPTYPPDYPPTYPPTYLPTYPPTYLPTYPPTHPPTYLPTHPPTHPTIHPPTYLPTYLPTHPPTHPPTYLPTHPTTYLPTHLPTWTMPNMAEVNMANTNIAIPRKSQHKNFHVTCLRP